MYTLCNIQCANCTLYNVQLQQSCLRHSCKFSFCHFIIIMAWQCFFIDTSLWRWWKWPWELWWSVWVIILWWRWWRWWSYCDDDGDSNSIGCVANVTPIFRRSCRSNVCFVTCCHCNFDIKHTNMVVMVTMMVKMVMKMVNMVKMVIRFDNFHFWLENFSTTQDENSPKSLHEIKISLESIAWTTNSLLFLPRSRLREILSSLTKNHWISLKARRALSRAVINSNLVVTNIRFFWISLWRHKAGRQANEVFLQCNSPPNMDIGHLKPNGRGWNIEVSKSVIGMHWKMLLLGLEYPVRLNCQLGSLICKK